MWKESQLNYNIFETRYNNNKYFTCILSIYNYDSLHFLRKLLKIIGLKIFEFIFALNEQNKISEVKSIKFIY